MTTPPQTKTLSLEFLGKYIFKEISSSIVLNTEIIFY